MSTSRPIARPLVFAAVLLTAPLFVAATPVQASTTDSGCTVTPDRPVYSGVNDSSNRPYVDYRITATCEAGLTVEVKQVRMEQDQLSREGDPGDDTTGRFTKVFDFTNGAGTKSVKVRVLLANTGPANEGAIEEPYQKLKFSVTSGPVRSEFTPFELTDIRRIAH